MGYTLFTEHKECSWSPEKEEQIGFCATSLLSRSFAD